MTLPAAGADRPSRFGRTFYRVGPEMDRRGASRHRALMVSNLAGVGVEIGAGYGATFELYPAQVAHVLALEPDDFLRERAGLAAARADTDIRVVPDTAEHIPSKNESVDFVVSSLVLCSVRRQEEVLAEIRRVLKPGGSLVFYEHVRSRNCLLAWLEDRVTPLWRRAAGGCHPNRDTVRAIAAAGFIIDSVERFGFRVSALSPSVAHVIGRARPTARPADGNER